MNESIKLGSFRPFDPDTEILDRRTTMTVAELLTAWDCLDAIMRDRRMFPTKGAFLLSRLYRSLAVEVEPIFEQKRAIIMGLDPVGIAGPNGQPQMAVPDERVAEFNERFAPLAATELKLFIVPVPVDALSISDNVAGLITADEFNALGPLIAA